MKLVDSDYITGYGLPWCFREDARMTAQQGRSFIINLADKGSPGTHWTAARLTPSTLYYADPFGTMLNGWPPRELEGAAPRTMSNKISFQRPKSTLCGYYAICFALVMDCIDHDLSQDEFEEALYRSIL